jgi:hypothetical protein
LRYTFIPTPKENTNLRVTGGYQYIYWHPPVILRLVFSLGVGMKGYLYTILASSSSPEVSIFFSCRNEGIPLYYIGILQ